MAVHKWVVPCNWKFPAENFGGDSYHVHWSHLSAIKRGLALVCRPPTTTGGAWLLSRQWSLHDCSGPAGRG